MTHRTFDPAIFGLMKALFPLALLPLATACADAGPTKDPAPTTHTEPAVPTALTAAHEAYLADDLVGMSRGIRDVLMTTPLDADVRDNAFALLEAAYERKDGRVPTDWELPRGMKRLAFGQVLGSAPGTARLKTWVRVRVDDASLIEQVLVTHDGKALIDKAGGVLNTTKVEPNEDGSVDVSLQVDDQPPIEPGVYELRLTMSGAPTVAGWVIVGNLAPTTAPILRLPIQDSIVDGNPTLSFDPFFSPAYKRFEYRNLWVGVRTEGRKDGFDWELSTDKLEPGGDIILGKDPRGSSHITLPPGRYWVSVNPSERRHFGPVDLVRSSLTTLPFRVE